MFSAIKELISVFKKPKYPNEHCVTPDCSNMVKKDSAVVWIRVNEQDFKLKICDRCADLLQNAINEKDFIPIHIDETLRNTNTKR